MSRWKSTPSTRELEVLQALAVHGSVKDAAQALFASKHTVDGTVDRLREKSGLHTVHQIVAWAYEEGYFPVPRAEERRKSDDRDGEGVR